MSTLGDLARHEFAAGPRQAVRALGNLVRAHPTGAAAAVVLLLLAAAAAAAPLVAPYSPNERFDVGPYAGISSDHLLGTDAQGRDVLSRLIWAGRISLASAVLPALIAVPVGLLVGVLAAEIRGALEDVLMRAVDIGLAFPIVLLAISLAGVVGGGFWTVVVAIAFALTPYIARVAYSVAQTVRVADFVTVARATGESRRQILLWELLPNVVPPVVVYVTSLLGPIMIVAAGLGFFGLGVPPPATDWGAMIDQGRIVLETDPVLALAPGALVVVTALCFNFLGDAIRDVLDPGR